MMLVTLVEYSGRSSLFSTPGSVADPGLRSRKAGTFSRMKPEQETYFSNTQGEVWDHVYMSLACEGVNSRTESYEELLKHRLAKAGRAFPECLPMEGCNGLAVLIDRKVISVDLFGNKESYRYYFPMLRDAAFTLSRPNAEKSQIDNHEAYFRTLEAIDWFNDAGRRAEELYPGAGMLHLVENEHLVGFSLTHNEELIHNAFFAKQN